MAITTKAKIPILTAEEKTEKIEEKIQIAIITSLDNVNFFVLLNIISSNNRITKAWVCRCSATMV